MLIIKIEDTNKKSFVILIYVFMSFFCFEFIFRVIILIDFYTPT